jgi:small-conductance mechanosensitive channel
MKATRFILLFFTVYLLFHVPDITAQDITEVVSDTSKQAPETIPLAEVSVRSGEVIITTKKTMETLIASDEISRMEHNNDSLLAIADSLLQLDRSINFDRKNIRYLLNKETYWKGIAAMVDSEKSRLSGIVQELDETKYDLENEMILWKNTEEILREEDPGSSVITRINDIVFKLDSVRNLIQGKTELMLKILDETTVKSLAVEDQLELIEKNIKEKEDEIFVAIQPPIWRTDFSEPKAWSLLQPIRQFLGMEIKELKTYLGKNTPNVVFQVILLILIIITFILIKHRLSKADINENSFYQRMLVRILSRPVAAALILGLFASVLIFKNRPLIFSDISKIVIVVPLVILVAHLAERRFYKFFYPLLFVMLLQLFYYVFPPGHILYQLSLLAIAMVELSVLWALFRYFQKTPLRGPKISNRLLLFLVLVHLGFAFAGLIGIISGANMLAEVALNIPIINAFAGILLVISALILNGLTEVAIESRSLRKLNIFKHHGRYIEPRIARLINFLAFVIWLFTMLKNIKIDRLVVDQVTIIFTDEIKIGSASFTLGGIVIFFLVIWLSIIISKIIRVVLEEDILDKFSLGKGVPHTISVMVRYTLVTIGVLLAVSAAGMPLDSLTILFGAFGVGIGFGLQNIFNNLVSGLILLFERPIQIGDTIEVGQLMGNVKSIGIRSSNVRTFDGAEVIVPNGQLISNEVVNWTLSDQTRRIEVIAGVAYGSDPHKVKDLFEKVLNDHPDIIKDPAPKVFFQNLGESSLDFRLLFWTSKFDEWIRIRSDIIFGVHDILKSEGIEIPFPQRDLHLRSADHHIEIVNKAKKAGEEK